MDLPRHVQTHLNTMVKRFRLFKIGPPVKYKEFLPVMNLASFIYHNPRNVNFALCPY